MECKLGGRFGFWALKSLTKRGSLSGSGDADGEPTAGAAKLERYFGKTIWSKLAGKVVLDFGCGEGKEAIAAALHGAKKVYGIDIRDTSLRIARESSSAVSMGDTCVFLNGISQAGEVQKIAGTVQVAYSLDSFEHLANPQQILATIAALLEDGGELYISFGPPWKHPFGCHMFFLHPIPWMHFIFQERTVMAVRSMYRQGGAQCYEDVEGGLNKMTIQRFERLTNQSGFKIENLHLAPIKGLHFLVRNRVAREYFTSVVQCVMKKTKPSPASSRASA
jgi:2-polyprenyl-3-methyl-5-hydroxy-6-metoxy-1,4-benzoquinol methylase